MIQMMSTLSVWFLLACLFDLLLGLTAIDETRYVRAGTDETLSCSMRGIVQTAAWLYCSNCDEDTTDSIYIASNSFRYTIYPRIERIAVVYDTNHGLYNLTLLNFNGQTDVGIYFCYIKKWHSGPSIYYYSVEFADGPSIATITGNVPVFADDSSSLTLTCAAAAKPGVTIKWKNGNEIIGHSNTLTLSPARKDNGVTITCTAMNREYDDIRASVSVTLEVHYGPKSVTITGGPVYANGTNRLTLTCTAEEYSPDVEFQWEEGSQHISGQNTNTFTKIADKTDNGRTLTCLAWNTMNTNKRKETSTQLTVYYGPDNADIVGTSTVYADGVKTLTFTCIAAASSPGVRFQWTKGGMSIGDNSETLTFTPVPTDDGKDVVCIATNTGHQNGQATDSVTLTVYWTHEEEKHSKLGVIIGGTIAVLVVILLCVVVFVLIWRRRSTKAKSGLDMSKVRINRNILDTNPDEGDSADNRMYVSSGPSPKTMDVMYSKVNTLKKTPPTQDSGEAVYSQVKKKGKVEDDDNVYAQVDKKLLRNKDGLTYAELAFAETNQQQPAQIIHGLEDTTDYAAIDFTKRGPTPPQTNVAEAGTAKEETQN